MADDGPLRVGPDGQHGTSRIVVLLDAARVGEDESCARHDRQERDIAEWLDDPDPVRIGQTRGLRAGAAPWVQRDDQRDHCRDAVECSTTARALASESTFEGRCSVTTP